MFPDVVWIDHVIIRVSMYYDCMWVCCVHVNAGHVCVTAGMEVGERCWRISSRSTMILRWNSVDRPAGQAPSAAQPQCQSCFWTFRELPDQFPQWLDYFTFPPFPQSWTDVRPSPAPTQPVFFAFGTTRLWLRWDVRWSQLRRQMPRFSPSWNVSDTWCNMKVERG